MNVYTFCCKRYAMRCLAILLIWGMLTASMAAPASAPLPVSQQVAEQLRFLNGVNRAVNRQIRPMSDQAQYGVAERWVMDPASNAGDCEDYALTKWNRINRRFGRANLRMVTLSMPSPSQRGQREGHAVLEVRLADGSTVILDNLHDNVMRRSALERRGYRWDW